MHGIVDRETITSEGILADGEPQSNILAGSRWTMMQTTGVRWKLGEIRNHHWTPARPMALAI